MEIESTFKKLAESGYDVKLGLTLSDKGSGVTVTSSIDKDSLHNVSMFVEATMREADNECMKRKIDKMKSFKVDINADIDLELGGLRFTTKKVVEKLKKEGAKAAYVSLLLASSFDSMEGFEFVDAGKDSHCITRQVGTIDGIKIFFYGELKYNDTTVLYE